VIELFVPGRLCLFGEHSDWAGEFRSRDASVAPGACIITGTDQGITARAEAAAEFELTSRLPDGTVRGPFRVPMEEAALRRAAQAGEFFSYAAGVAAEIAGRCRIGGVRITVKRMDLPIARGLSSSAAICVLTARAFSRVHALGLSIREEMEFAYRGELAAGSQCGRMDQGCAYGVRPVLLRFDGDRLAAEPLAAGGRIHLLVADLQHPKDTRRILADLHRHFRAGETATGRGLRRALGEENLAIVERARAALVDGDAPALGALMTEAQALFDRAVARACPSELAAPRLHAILAHPAAQALAWGGKGVGSQGDGAAQFVCRGADERRALAQELEATAGVRCLAVTIGVRGEDT
jgi:mevalonate kinase